MTGAPYPTATFSATAAAPTPPFATPPFGTQAMGQAGGKGPSVRTKAVVAVAATLGLAAAGTGIYFGLHGSGGSPSASGTNTPTGAPAVGIQAQSSPSQSPTPAATTRTDPLSSDHGIVIKCATGTINGSGSATQEAAIDKVIAAYETACPGATIGYKASGFGLTDFGGGYEDFTAQDVPMTADQQSAAGKRCGAGGSAASIVVSAQPDVIVYKIPGVAPTALNLSGTTAAKIFNGVVTSWNDPAIVHDNPGLTLPNIPIQEFHWGQAAGISYALADYLHASDPTDFSQPPDINWPAGGGTTVGGADSMASSIASTDGSIGYLDAATATAHNFGVASLDGVPMTTKNVGFQLGETTKDYTGGNVILRSDFRTPVKNKYPFVSFAYEITCVTGNDPASLPLLKSFLGYVASPPGQRMLRDAGYTDLPDSPQAQTSLTFQKLQ
jgi:phosphate transport system substrate-binding protein